MGPKEIEVLAKEARSDRRKMDRLVKELNALACGVTAYYVRKTRGGENHRDDIYNSALMGIPNAVKSFDFDHTGFVPYAKSAMEMEVRDYLNEAVRTIRLPKHVITDISRIRKAEDGYLSKNVTPSMEEIKARSGIKSEKTFRNAIEARKLEDTYSLDYVLGSDEDDDYTLGSTVSSEEDTEKTVMEGELDEKLESSVIGLSPVDRFVILHSYGLYGRRRYSNSELSEKLGLTVASVINHRNRALDSLRTTLSSWAV